MIDFLLKPTIEIDDLQKLIDNEIGESNSLEYKSGLALNKSDKAKNEIAKDISAFANSNGGVLIYGIEEINDKPHGFQYVNGEEFSHEKLEQIIQTRIHRKIENIKITPLRVNGDLKKSIYVVQIPESERAPHMTNSNKFFTRHNFEVVAMEEYEVRNQYLKRSKVELTFSEIRAVGDQYSRMMPRSTFRNGNFRIWIEIFNPGKTICKHHKLQIRMGRQNVNNWEIEKSEYLNQYVKRVEEENIIYSVLGKETIFPNEKFNYGYVRIKLKDLTEVDVGNKLFELKLHHEGGIVSKEFTIKDAFL